MIATFEEYVRAVFDARGAELLHEHVAMCRLCHCQEHGARPQ